MSKRAAAGESSIGKGSDGKWHGYVSMGLKDNGKRDRRHVSAAKRADVVAKVRALEKKRDEGIVQAAGAGAQTVGQWLDHWVSVIAPARVRPRTLEGYESKIRLHLKPALGHHRLDRLQPEHVEALYVAKITAGLASGTVLVCHRILSRALKVAEQRGRVARNVALLVDPPSATFEEVVPLTAEEARKVLAKAHGERNAARWSVALALGLRQGEALGVTWTDLDLEQGVWNVRRQLQRLSYRHGCQAAPCGQEKPRACPQRKGGLVSSEPKTARGRRSIGLPPQLLADLKAHRQAQVVERLEAGSLWEDHDLVFCSPHRQAARPARRLGGVARPARVRGCPAGPPPRRPAHRGNPSAGAERPRPRGDGDPRPLHHRRHAKHLRPRHVRGRHDRHDGRCERAVGT